MSGKRCRGRNPIIRMNYWEEIDMNEQQEMARKRRIYEDRKQLYDRMMRIGFIPDKDMRDDIDRICSELNNRIMALGDELMAGNAK